MKWFTRSLYLSVVLAGLALPAHAQRVSLGVKGGVNAVKFTGKDLVGPGMKTYFRIAGGGFMVVDLGKFIQFQPELLYAQKGTKYEDSDEVVQTRVDYLEVPLLARLQLPTHGSRLLPYAIVGPTFAFNTSCRLSGINENTEVDMSCDDPQAPLPVKNIDYGIAAGAGADMAVGRAIVGLDARYVMGLTKLDDSPSHRDVKNRVVSVMLGVRVPLGGGPVQAASRNF